MDESDKINARNIRLLVAALFGLLLAHTKYEYLSYAGLLIAILAWIGGWINEGRRATLNAELNAREYWPTGFSTPAEPANPAPWDPRGVGVRASVERPGRALTQLRTTADQFEAEHGPDAKLKPMANEEPKPVGRINAMRGR